MRTRTQTIIIILAAMLALMSCGKEKDNSHVPSGRVARMTVTQHHAHQWELRVQLVHLHRQPQRNELQRSQYRFLFTPCSG